MDGIVFASTSLQLEETFFERRNVFRKQNTDEEEYYPLRSNPSSETERKPKIMIYIELFHLKSKYLTVTKK